MQLSCCDAIPASSPAGGPVLLVVVDTEEEFDWTLPFDRSATSTNSVVAQELAHEVFDRYGVVPTYVVNHAVASSPSASRYLRRLVDEKRADFGTHCHPWITPPTVEPVNSVNSFHGNLPLELEMAKLESSTDAVAQAFGSRPYIFKAGRYGVGPNTFQILRQLGYRVDCSFVPTTNFAHEGGPSFLNTPARPFFVDASRSLYEVPLTVGYCGWGWRLGARWPGFWDHPVACRWRLPGLMSRAGALWRARLSPEGFDAQTQIALIDALLARGDRVFTLTYHSTSLAPGNTPYVRDRADLDEFLKRVDEVLAHFRDVVGGRFTTLGELWREAQTETPPQA